MVEAKVGVRVVLTMYDNGQKVDEDRLWADYTLSDELRQELAAWTKEHEKNSTAKLRPPGEWALLLEDVIPEVVYRQWAASIIYWDYGLHDKEVTPENCDIWNEFASEYVEAFRYDPEVCSIEKLASYLEQLDYPFVKTRLLNHKDSFVSLKQGCRQRKMFIKSISRFPAESRIQGEQNQCQD